MFSTSDSSSTSRNGSGSAPMACCSASPFARLRKCVSGVPSSAISSTSSSSSGSIVFSPAEAASFLRGRNGEAPSPFTIVQLSDTHVGFQGPPDPLGTKAFERAVDLINGLDTRPDLILFTGDLTHDSEDPAEHAKRMKSFRTIADRLHVKKRFYVPAEHDAALDA